MLKSGWMGWVIVLGVAGCGAGPNSRDGFAEGGSRIRGPVPPPVIGTNLSWVTDWSPNIVYADVIKSSRGFGPGPWVLNAAGWPVQLNNAIPRSYYHSDTTVPSGTYVLYVSGKGTVSFYGADFSGTYHGNGSSQRFLVPYTSKGGSNYFEISATDPVDPIRIELYYPGHDRGDFFHHHMLRDLAGFKVLRFMDPMFTNFRKPQFGVWSQRTLPISRSLATDGGMPWEVQLLLAQTLGADAWLNLPHDVDDVYLLKFAEFIKTFLVVNRTMKLYIEASNEPWNGFSQKQGLVQIATKLGFGSGWPAQMIGATHLLSKAGFVLGQMLGPEMSRVRLVLNTQVDNAGVAAEICTELKDPRINPWKTPVYALAGGMYFGAIDQWVLRELNNPTTPKPTVADVIAEARRTIPEDIGYGYGPGPSSTLQTIRYIESHCPVGSEGPIQFIAYEGGQHMVNHSKDPRVGALLKAANHHPDMECAYRDMINTWQRIRPGSLFVHYANIAEDGDNASDGGYWGAKNYLLQAKPPKRLALDAAMGLRAWSDRCR